MPAPTPVREVAVFNLLAGRRFLIEWRLNDGSEGVTAYEVHRSTTEYTGYELIATVASPDRQYIDKVPYTFGITYFYKVLARNAAGILGDVNEASPVSDMTFDSFEERPFRATTVTFDSFVKGETPTGTQDSVNADFTTALFFRFNTVEVFRNGAALVRGTDFTEGNDQQTITFSTPPGPADTLLVNYLKV